MGFFSLFSCGTDTSLRKAHVLLPPHLICTHFHKQPLSATGALNSFSKALPTRMWAFSKPSFFPFLVSSNHICGLSGDVKCTNRYQYKLQA